LATATLSGLDALTTRNRFSGPSPARAGAWHASAATQHAASRIVRTAARAAAGTTDGTAALKAHKRADVTSGDERGSRCIVHRRRVDRADDGMDGFVRGHIDYREKEPG
jgi:hypothetical protein